MENNNTFVMLDTAGDQVTPTVDLIGIIWTGATSAGDTCVLKQINGDPLWEGRADGSHTYLGVRFPDTGIRIKKGIELLSISAGKVFLYFREP